MSNKQPEALRLAEQLETEWGDDCELDKAAAELRRLHEQNDRFADGILSMGRRIAALEEVNGELLEALQVLADEASSFSVDGVYFNEKCMGHKGLDMAFDAIAKAKGEQL